MIAASSRTPYSVPAGGAFSLKTVLALLFFTCATALPAAAQSDATTSRAGDLQVGGGFTIAHPDYGTSNLQGFNLFATFDFKYWLGIEASFRNATAGDATNIYERTYEIGPRVVYPVGSKLHPYAKVLIGRGVFNYPPDCLDASGFAISCTSSGVVTRNSVNLAYNEVAFGGGADFLVHPRISIRIDYEYQDWLNFRPHDLTPQVLSLGVAYHFGSGNLSVR